MIFRFEGGLTVGRLAKFGLFKRNFIMNTETVTVHKKGERFEVIIQHDQSGSAYGVTLSKSA